MEEKRNPNTLRIFVRAGAAKRFHALKEKSAGLPVVVDWDRRGGERRTAAVAPAADQRKADRRGTPPFTWELADFVLVEEPATTPKRTGAKKKASAPPPQMRKATAAPRRRKG
jgi:hypothetical protein